MIDPLPQAARNAPARLRAGRLAPAAAALAAWLLASPPAVEAGSYVVAQCGPAHAGSQAAWERTADGYLRRDRCSAGSGLQISSDAERTAQGRFGALAWSAPPGTIFAALRVNASLTAHAGHGAELRTISERGGATRFGGTHDAFRVYRRSGPLARFEARLRCARAGGCGRAAADRAHTYVKGVQLRVRDVTPPRVTAIAGDLFGRRVVRGERSAELEAADRGGGVRRLSLEAGGTPLAGAAIACELSAGFATRLSPCPRRVAATRSVATTHPSLATGPNAISACAEDLALGGRANRGCHRQIVWVDNECPASSSRGARLTARLGGRGPRATLPSNRRALVAGRLRDEAGQPLAGATVCALTRVSLAGAPVRLAATRRTDAAGRYSIPMRPGPSREVFVHQASGDEVVARHGLALRSVARPSLRLRARDGARSGDLLRFRGRLPGPACAGRTVAIEAGVPGGGWQAFRTARSDRRCRFAARYRLRATTSAARYRFRAHVRRQPGYPYAAGASGVRRLRVGG